MNNFIKTTLILAQNLRKAKNKARFVVPQNIRTKCLEQSVCDIWFSYSVKDFCYCISLMYYGKLRKKLVKNENKLRTIYPKNHDNFKNSKYRVQFYWFL